MILINGASENSIKVADRGLQYGDGLFETIAFRHKQLEFLDAHLDRLIHGCARLKIPFTNKNLLVDELDQLLADQQQDATVKIIITRGQGGRGYRPPAESVPTRILSVYPLPDYPLERQHGVKVRLCQQLLSENTTLAGIKHLNRLEQVMARSEWDDDDIAEGLMMTNKGQFIEGTMTNLFVIKAHKLLTPAIDKAGVAGIMRGQIFNIAKKLGIPVEIKPIELSHLETADEVFVSNSLIGIWPVSHIDRLDWQPTNIALTKTLQHQLSLLMR